MRALSRRPAGLLGGVGTELFNWFERARDYYFSLPRPKFEAMTLGLAFLVGLLVMPALIYLAGRYTLHSRTRTAACSRCTSTSSRACSNCGRAAGSWWLGPFVFLSLFDSSA